MSTIRSAPSSSRSTGSRSRCRDWPPSSPACAPHRGFALGSALPLVVLLLYPSAWESRVLFAAVVLSLCLTSVLIAVSSGTSVRRAILRTVSIGVLSMAISYVAGLIVF